jgi:hypothetical protein
VAMQDNRKSASRNSESTLSHRHHSLNLVRPSSWGLCTQERDEDGDAPMMEEEEVMVALVVSVTSNAR